MARTRDLKLDLFALALCAVTVFLGAALGSYDPADPVPHWVAPLDRFYQPDVLVDPQNETVTNACGAWGALASDLMLNFLGIGAYYLVLSLAVVDYLLLRRREIDSQFVRAIGWTLSLVGLCTLATFLLPSWSPGPVIGPGGYLGALGRAVLRQHFATLGGLILTLSAILGGLLLCTDYALLRVARLVLAAAILGVTKVPAGRLLPRRAAHRHDDAWDDEEQEWEQSEESQDEALSIRVRGKRVDAEQEDDAEDEEALEEGDDESDEDLELTADDDQVEAAESTTKVRATRGKRARADQGETGVPVRRRKPAARDEREEVMSSLDQASLAPDEGDYQLPTADLLTAGDDFCFDEQTKEVRRKAQILEKTFADFGFKVKVVEIETGPVIAQYEVALEAGLRLSKITGLADDLAIALRVPSVRIVAPIPGKNTVGIEVPNEVRQTVRLREVLEEANGKTRKMKIPLYAGKDVSGKPIVVDLASLPHLLIAGRTGTGKSVCLNAIIASILMTRRPDEVRMLMIDPKMVELSGYGRLPHLMHPVVTDMRKAEAILAWAVDKMEERYTLLAKAGVRHITSYNQLGREELLKRLQPENEGDEKLIPDHLPFIVIVADEMADLMMTAGKEVEQHIIRLAQKSRAVGIHLILATQKPTVDVITGLIKSNLPARISFQVASRTDSRVVLDEMGAEKLLGNGDMLFLWPGTSTLVRGQGTFLSDEEINRIVDVVSTGEQNFVNELVNIKVEENEEGQVAQLRKRDDLYEQAVDVIVREGRGSVSLLQRCLGIGYGRAARLVDFMAEDGIVGDYAGSQAREVLISLSDWEALKSGDSGDDDDPDPDPEPPVPPRRTNKIRLADDPPDEALDEQAIDEPARRSASARLAGATVTADAVAGAEHDDESHHNEYDAIEEDEVEEDEVEDDEGEYEEGEYEEGEYEEETGDDEGEFEADEERDPNVVEVGEHEEDDYDVAAEDDNGAGEADEYEEVEYEEGDYDQHEDEEAEDEQEEYDDEEELEYEEEYEAAYDEDEEEDDEEADVGADECDEVYAEEDEYEEVAAADDDQWEYEDEPEDEPVDAAEEYASETVPRPRRRRKSA